MLVQGCANERSNPLSLSAAAAEAPTGAITRTPQPPPVEASRKIASSRFLAAMALERATGLKPDPGRLVEQP